MSESEKETFHPDAVPVRALQIVSEIFVCCAYFRNEIQNHVPGCKERVDVQAAIARVLDYAGELSNVLGEPVEGDWLEHSEKLLLAAKSRARAALVSIPGGRS